MKGEAVFIDLAHSMSYLFHDHHPFHPQRLALTTDLLNKSGALEAKWIAQGQAALEEELLLIHSKTYVESVKKISVPSPSDADLNEARSFGLGSEDTPAFTNMHQITSGVVGGTLEAAKLVMNGQYLHALHLGGGLHHAFGNKGGGFCIYNDASIAIAYIRKHYHARVLYIDTDVHHGDGVQWSYYTDPNVCTLSIHETGKYLFPGTGGVNERGEETGYGYCYNFPVEPYTEDESWLETFEEALLRVAAYFKPDVIVSQHGCDAHAFDPLAHIHCSMEIYQQMPELLHRIAHQYCEGRWIALGGGGYDPWRVVPRAWSLLWMEMSDHLIAFQLKKDKSILLPHDWVTHWDPQSPQGLPITWLDNKQVWEPMPRRQKIAENNRKMTEIALQFLPNR